MNNPYDLVKVFIYGLDVYARPVEFSGSIVDHNKCLDGFGKPVRPVKVLLTCPACGSPIYYDLIGDCVCEVCEASKPKKVNPFRDPVRRNMIKMCDLIDHAYNPAIGFDLKVDMDKRRAMFSDFVEHGMHHTLPKSDLGLEDMVEE